MICVHGRAPAHIHVLGHGGAAEVLIGPLALRAVRGPRGNAQVRKVMQIAAGRQAGRPHCGKRGGSTMAKPIDDVDEVQIAAARAAGARSLRAARAIAARCLPERDRVEIDLASGWSVQVPRAFSARLAGATREACERIEVVDSGLGLHRPAIDEDWYVPAVIEALAVPGAT